MQSDLAVEEEWVIWILLGIGVQRYLEIFHRRCIGYLSQKFIHKSLLYDRAECELAITLLAALKGVSR